MSTPAMTALPTSYAPPAEPSTLEKAIQAPETPFTRWLVRWRMWFFAGLAVLVVVQFNGQWRVGLDSSIYRGVADSLAAGRGYTFAGRAQTQIYPGLPVMLAGLQKVFGHSLIPPLVLMNAFALLTLAGVYQLIKLRYPLWIAVVVTCGVGMNARFVIQAQEIMTDTPFLCAVVWAMLAWEWLAGVQTRRRRFGTVALLAAGLFVAATMRPTFWVLAAAWAATALWNVARKRERRSLIALGVLAAVLMAFMAVDPRARGMNVLQGGYEKQLVMLLPDLGARMQANAQTLFAREIPEAFFNEVMTGTAMPFTLLLLAGAVLLTKRQPLWGLQVLILTVVMLVISDVARYYLMVLPALWLSYVLGILWLTARFKPQVRDVAMFALFSVANVQNLGGSLGMGVEQHSRPFLQTYKHGTYVADMAMADVLKQKLGPDDVVVGPGAQVLSYLSGRQVVNGRLLGFDVGKPSRYPDMVAAAKPTYMIGPASEYDKKDSDLYKLLIRGVIVPGTLVARSGDFWLAEATVNVPTGDWRQQPRVRPYPLAAKPATRPAMTPQEAKNRQIKAQRLRKQIKAERVERAERRARNERKLIRQRRAAATQKATPVPTTPAPPIAPPPPARPPAATGPTSFLWPLPPAWDGFGRPVGFPSSGPLRSMPA